MSDIISILNTLRSTASQDYQNVVPLATRNNLTTVGSAILSYDTTTNEFIDSLVNRIAFTVVQNKVFKNPLSVLKKGGIPYGQDIQEIYTNPAKGGTYTADSTDLLKTFKADTKVAYYRLNRKGKFTLTVSQEQLQLAFTSIQDFDNFLTSIINSLNNGDEIEQFEITKNMIASAYSNNMITVVNLYDENTEGSLTDADIAKRIVKAIKTYSELLTFPSTQYNKFATIKGNGATPVTTWTPKKDQVLILPSNVKVNMDVEVLSYAFNLALSNIDTMMLTVDSFIDQPILGVLCDKSCFQIYDNLIRLNNFNNGDLMTLNYFYHHWQTFGFSLLANSIVFTYTPKTA